MVTGLVLSFSNMSDIPTFRFNLFPKFPNVPVVTAVGFSLDRLRKCIAFQVSADVEKLRVLEWFFAELKLELTVYCRHQRKKIVLVSTAHDS